MNKTIYIGVDPSINSTGVVIRDGKETYFYIIKNNDHKLNSKGVEKDPLTKKERIAQETQEHFEYVLYDKMYGAKEESSYDRESRKTQSLVNICKTLDDIISRHTIGGCICNACIEGISYGSSGHTTAIYDLAGLNYLLRKTLYDHCDNVLIAPPGHVKKFATGNGSADKDTMITVFEAIHPELDIPKKDDIADAWFMSLMAEKEI